MFQVAEAARLHREIDELSAAGDAPILRKVE
jgi:hypothetical protein